jgi:2-keto-4-pentenoate hydratase/2-oxohepta-3-ene-1,7-dioic acid hydratase in catechol pathway
VPVRLVTYAREGKRRLGTLVDETVVDLPDAVGHPAFPETMEAMVRTGLGGLGVAREALARDGAAERHAVSGGGLLAPLLPGSLRDFLAFEDHVRDGAARRGQGVPDPWYRMPVYYKGNHRSIYGPDEEVPWPRYTSELDYELEVACILGGRGRDLDEDGAAAIIFGYTLMNDWSARDVQRDEMACGLGPAKAKDFATSLGPCVVTADELDPGDLWLTARVDGEIWSKGNLGASRWTFPQMIAHVSQDEEVWPGDVYGSGTFGGGCGLDLDRSLWPGAVVELEADRIGILRNTVAAA